MVTAEPVEEFVETAHGPARLVVRRAREARAAMVLSHGAGRGIDGNDLTAVATAMPRVGIDTYLVEQPWVARGRKVADRPQVPDAVVLGRGRRSEWLHSGTRWPAWPWPFRCIRQVARNAPGWRSCSILVCRPW